MELLPDRSSSLLDLDLYPEPRVLHDEWLWFTEDPELEELLNPWNPLPA